ncbi:MAG: MBG domain-containing protein, partial [Ilumatobacteraceae bacterium]
MISPKSLSITADDKSKTAGASDPTFTYTSSGLVGSDTVNGVTFTYAGSGATSYGPSTTAPSAAGTYTNTPSVATFSSGSSSNYTITYVAGTYTINAAGGGGGGGGGGTTTTTTTTVAAATTTTTTRPPRRISICHATGSASNPYVQITVDAEGLNGHGDHADDIIPAPAGGCSARVVARAQAATTTTRVPRRISICHATGSDTNPYVEITVDVEGLNGHGDHAGDIIPAPLGGCSLEAVNSQRVTTTTAPRRISICHATGSETNPYVEITVDANGLNGHGAHDDD